MHSTDTAPHHAHNVQQPHESSSNAKCSPDFLKTIPGILKIVEMVSHHYLSGIEIFD